MSERARPFLIHILQKYHVQEAYEFDIIIDLIKLIKGDAFRVLKKFDDKSIDTIFADSPYYDIIVKKEKD